MTQRESGPFANRLMSSSVPIDEDPEAMRQLFGTMRGAVITDIDRYTGGEYDAENNPKMAALLGKSSIDIQEEFTERNVYAARSSASLDIFKPGRVQRAYDIVTTIEVMNLFLYEAEDPDEAWERGLDVAATVRLKEELARRQKSMSGQSLMGYLALQLQGNPGQ